MHSGSTEVPCAIEWRSNHAPLAGCTGGTADSRGRHVAKRTPSIHQPLFALRSFAGRCNETPAARALPVLSSATSPSERSETQRGPTARTTPTDLCAAERSLSPAPRRSRGQALTDREHPTARGSLAVAEATPTRTKKPAAKQTQLRTTRGSRCGQTTRCANLLLPSQVLLTTCR